MFLLFLFSSYSCSYFITCSSLLTSLFYKSWRILALSFFSFFFFSSPYFYFYFRVYSFFTKYSSLFFFVSSAPSFPPLFCFIFQSSSLISNPFLLFDRSFSSSLYSPFNSMSLFAPNIFPFPLPQFCLTLPLFSLHKSSSLLSACTSSFRFCFLSKGGSQSPLDGLWLRIVWMKLNRF